MNRVPLVKDMLVKTLLNAKKHQGVESLSLDNTIKEAAQFMRTKRISSVVVRQDQKPVGIITERDLSNSLATYDNPGPIPLSKIMTPWEKVKTVSLGATVGDAEKEMIALGVRHMPVSDESDNLVGMLSQRDINDAFYKNEELIASQTQ